MDAKPTTPEAPLTGHPAPAAERPATAAAAPVTGSEPSGPAPAVSGPASAPPGAVGQPGGAHGAAVPGGAAARPVGRRLLAPVATLAGVAAAFAYVGAVDPNEPGHYPVCPLLRFTGLYCPGCGGLRSAHAFVHGEFATAFGANALAVVGYGLFAVVMAVWLIRAVRGVPMRVAISPAWWWGIGAVLALFTVIRNLPFGSALAP
ncbi:DUF2752 domain-containing protein [Streptomyces sp. NPDC014870]|uniref:DUF2752 domain-containing protein n=1 Tax=Streptomyces sp. NPDC014870 TaxID=3364925 RepID=UPI0036FA32C6